MFGDKAFIIQFFRGSSPEHAGRNSEACDDIPEKHSCRIPYSSAQSLPHASSFVGRGVGFLHFRMVAFFLRV